MHNLLIPTLIYFHTKSEGTNSTAVLPLEVVPWNRDDTGVLRNAGIANSVILTGFMVMSYATDAFSVMNAYLISRLSNLLGYKFERLTVNHGKKREMINLIKQHEKLAACNENYQLNYLSEFLLLQHDGKFNYVRNINISTFYS